MKPRDEFSTDKPIDDFRSFPRDVLHLIGIGKIVIEKSLLVFAGHVGHDQRVLLGPNTSVTQRRIPERIELICRVC